MKPVTVANAVLLRMRLRGHAQEKQGAIQQGKAYPYHVETSSSVRSEPLQGLSGCCLVLLVRAVAVHICTVIHDESLACGRCHYVGEAHDLKESVPVDCPPWSSTIARRSVLCISIGQLRQ